MASELGLTPELNALLVAFGICACSLAIFRYDSAIQFVFWGSLTMALIHLIYVSTARIKLDDSELDKVLESSVRHNASQDITGMLLYADGNFMQVLEGEEAVIDETYGRIVLDSRHSQLFVLERNPIEKRSFDKWSMGFRRLGQAEMETHPAYSPFFEYGFNEKKMRPHPGIGMEMLIEFGLGQR